MAVAALATVTLATSVPTDAQSRHRRPAPPVRATPAARPAPLPTGVDRAARPPRARSPRNANYSIDVRLDGASRTLTGHEVISWRNITNTATSTLPFHLYYNAWRDTRSTWMREAAQRRRATVGLSDGNRGWADVSSVRLLSTPVGPVDLTPSRRYVAPDDGNPDDKTVMSVALPTPVLPGETITVEVSWTARIPRPISRTGTIGSYFFLAQWFPKVGVLEDAGWNCHQFHAATEFFSDYGVYDVGLTVPTGWVVGSSGQERSRRDNGDGTTTHTYHAEDIHDLAWTTSPDYVERKARFVHPSLPAVEMRLLLQPEHVAQADRHFDATRSALKYFGEWYGAYPYGYITIIDPAWQSRAGGMEYPTLFTAGTRWLAPEHVEDPTDITVHEAGHQFWYGLVGNNEFEDAWLDEGFNTYSTARAIEANPDSRVVHHETRFFGGFIPWVFRDIVKPREIYGDGLAGYRASAESDTPSTPSYRYYPATGGGLSYNKTALWLHTLERYLGWPTLQRVMSTYFDRWTFRHPKPADFFAVTNDVTGRDLTWYFDQVYRSSNTFDYGVDFARSEPVESDEPDAPPRFRTTVIVRRYGEAVFPVTIEVVFQNGERLSEQWSGDDRWKALTYERGVGVDYAVVDPARTLLLDVNYTNNSYGRHARTDEAADKWSLKWMVWLQDVLLTYACLL
jgi:hypothetical protein